MTVLTTTLYETESGRIIGSLTGTAELLAAQILPPGQALLYSPSDERTQMVVEGELVDRPIMPVTSDKTTIAADGEDVATITGIVPGSTVRFGAEDYVVEGGSLEITADAPGTYYLIYSGSPYQHWEIAINAA